MIRIFIEDFELDVSSTISQQITYAIDDLRNIDSKSTAFTKTIVLPGTAKNNKILGNIFEFNNSNFTSDNLPNVGYNFNASKASKCRLDSDGFKMIKGVFRLLQIIVDGNGIEYECSIIGELGGFANKLGAALLEHLDFSEYDHDYSIANIVASWDNANGGAGLYYPLMDVGKVSDGTYGTAKKDYQYQAFRPALFAKEYIDKIFEAAGYTYECDLFNTDRFKRIIIPHNQKFLFKNVSQLIDATIGTSQLVMTNPATYGEFSFDSEVLSNFTRVGNGYQYTGATTVQMTIDITINGHYSSDLQDLFLSFYQNSTRVNMENLPNLGGPGTTTFSTHFVIDTVISTNDVLTFAAESPSSIGSTYELYIDDAYFRLDASVPQLAEATIGDPIEMRFSIPKNILQKDFFTSILKLFNLLVDEDNFTEKHLVITPYVDYFAGTEDWSDKVDRGKPVIIKPMSELNARYYQFKFKSDSDYYNDLYKKRYNEGYGDRIFDSAFEFTKETDSVEVVFAPTPLVGYSAEDKVVGTVFKQNNNVEEKVDYVIRIMLAKKITGVASWSIMDGASVLHSDTNYPYAGHFDDPDAPANDLNFGTPKELFFVLVSGRINVNQFNVYYSPYMAEITDKDSRLVTCNLKLSDTDIFNLDFSKFKFIDGGLYRISRIIDFTPGANETTKAELLRVIYTTY